MGDTSPRWRSLLPAVRIVWPGALTAWIFVTAGRVGFNPTDEGFILAQSHRLLLGEVPHRDFVSPRPVASALLHLLDFALPLPLFEASRLIALAQVVAYSLLFATLVYGSGPHRWGFVHCVGAGAATLVNLHGFPLMAWYTIDGLTFTAAGLVLIEAGIGRSRRRLVDLGFLCLGIAPVTKQSFFAAPLLGLVRVAWERRGGVARGGLIAGLPAAVYVGTMAALGGFSDMVAQLGSAAPAWGTRLFSVVRVEPTRSALARVLGAATVVLLALTFVQRASRAHTIRQPLLSLAAVALRAWLSYLVIRTTLDQGLAPYPASTWGIQLVWVLAAVVLWQAIAARGALNWAMIVLLLVSWMTMLSWGWDVPDLVAGSVALCILHAVWAQAGLLGAPLRYHYRPLAIAAAVAAAVTGLSFREVRRELPYRDRPASQLTASLAAVSPQFGRIRTNPTTARYLGELVRCLRQWPARSVAVIPDNAWIYPALHLRSPFPVIWFLPSEFAGVADRVLAAASSLGRQGDYLVLFQTFKARLLPLQQDLEPATERSGPYVYGSRLGYEILRRLPGAPVRCGTFVGKYAGSPGVPGR